MSLKNRFFSILTIALGVVVFSTFAIAQDNKATTTIPDKVEREKGEGRGFHQRKGGREGFERKHGQRGGGMMRMLHGVNLTDAQKAQIHSILEANRPNESTKKEFQAIREARKAGTEITPEQKEQMKARREQSRARMESVHQQILAILTPEQKAQIEQKKLEMKQHMQERKQERMQRKQNPAATTTEKKDN